MDILPLFPLKIVVYPGEKLNLHIFEPRYKQLVAECEKSGNTFGIPAYIDNKVMDLGTEIRLVNIEKRYSNGELDIKTEGVRVFRIHEFFSKAPGKLYSAGEVEKLTDASKPDPQLSLRILEKIITLYEILDVKREIPQDPADLRTFDIAHHIGLSLEQEFKLLSIPNEPDRQQFVLEHLERLLPVVRQMEELKRKAKLNGQFQNHYPPEF